MVDISDRRREFLYSVVSIAGAGLTKFVWDRQNQGELLQVTQQAGPGQSGATSTFRVAEDDFTTWELAFDRPNRIHYSFEVVDGPPIDVILTDKSGQPQTDDEDWHYYPTASHLDDRGATVIDVLPPDSDYQLIFDNSNRLEASPPTNFREDPAIVTFQLDMSPLDEIAGNSTDEAPTAQSTDETAITPPTDKTAITPSTNETTTAANGTTTAPVGETTTTAPTNGTTTASSTDSDREGSSSGD